MNTNDVTVSVCMTVFNNERFIGKALDSILMQESTFPFEIVVCDDGSSDNTVEILKKYESKFPDIVKVLINETNMGIMRSLKRVFQMSKGKYIAMLDSDDHWQDPYKLQKQFDFLENNQEYVLSHHNVNLVDENDNIIDNGIVFMPKDYTQEEMMMALAPIRMATLFFRNERLNLMGQILGAKYSTTVLMHLIGFYGPSKYQEDVIDSIYRVHAGGDHSGRSKIEQVIKGFETKIILKNNMPSQNLKGKMMQAIEQRLLETLFVAFRERDNETYKKLIEYIKAEKEIETVPFLVKHGVDVVKRIGHKILKKLTGRS